MTQDVPEALTLPTGFHTAAVVLAWFKIAQWATAFVACALSAQAATNQVSDSLTRAIAEAHSGDTLLIAGPTVFTEHVIVSKPLRLIGTSAPVIDGSGTGTVLTIQSEDVEVRGLIIRNSGSDLGAYDAGVMITKPHVTIAACQIDNAAFGIYLRGASNCLIEGNEILGGLNLATAKRGNGIHLWKTARNQIVNNQIHDKRDGLYLSYADDNLISGNRIWDTRFGIHYMYAHQNRLLANSLTRNTIGATLMFSRGSLVQGNEIVANRRHGIVLKQLDNSRILDNVISGQNRGLFVQQAVQNRFVGNVISTNDIGLYLSNCSEQNVFIGNSFIQNTDQVWQPPYESEQGRLGPNSFYERSRGNYWSDYTGSDRDRNGLGDTPYHETEVFGRILDKHPEARMLALSPAVALLRKGEEILPLLDMSGVTDLYPLMRPPLRANVAKQTPASATLAIPAQTLNWRQNPLMQTAANSTDNRP